MLLRVEHILLKGDFNVVTRSIVIRNDFNVFLSKDILLEYVIFRRYGIIYWVKIWQVEHITVRGFSNIALS